MLFSSYSDDYYRAALITALGNTIVLNDFEVRHPERMTEEARCVLSEVLHALNMDTMKPSFGKIITCHCLYVIQSVSCLQNINSFNFCLCFYSCNVTSTYRSTWTCFGSLPSAGVSTRMYGFRAIWQDSFPVFMRRSANFFNLFGR